MINRSELKKGNDKMNHNKVINLFLVIICVSACLSAKEKSRMIDLPKIDYQGIVVSIEYCQDSIYGCVIYEGSDIRYCFNRSAFYGITLKNAFVSLTDSSDTSLLSYIQTGEHESYVTRLPPREEVELIKPGDTIVVMGYRMSGDEFAQSYSFDSLRISRQISRVTHDNPKIKKKVSNRAGVVIINGTQSLFKNYGSAYYTISGKRINSVGIHAGIFITDQISPKH